jgi:hypothetical protein
MQIKLDAIEGAYYRQDDQQRVYQRTGTATGISTVGTTDTTLLLRAVAQAAGMPQLYVDSATSDPEAKVTGVEVLSINEASDAARIRITYSTPTIKQQPVGGGGFVLEDDVTLTQASTQFVPGTSRKPLLIKQNFAGIPIQTYLATLNYQKPIRTITLSGLFTSPAKVAAIRAAIGKVNADPFLDLPRGYWLLTGLNSRTSDGGGSYGGTIQMATQVNQDWSHLIVMRDRHTDQFVTVTDSDIADVMALGYDYGNIGASISEGKGFARVGPYETANFLDPIS